MRGGRCGRAQELVARRRAGLSGAERLRLEEHLTECQACREEARALDAFAEIVDDDAARSRPSRHARAITRVLNAASEAELPAPASSSPRSAPYLLVGAMAAASVIGSAAYRADWGRDSAAPPAREMAEAPARLDRPAGPPAPEAPLAEAQVPKDRLDSGDLHADGAPVEPGGKVAGSAALETEAGAELALGSAIVELAAGGRASWEAERTTLRLDAGSVRARVDPLVGETFRVATESFTVEVVGTVFEVTSEGVEVEEGSVRVRDPRGEVIARVEAGESWQAPQGGEPPSARAPELDVAKALARAQSRLARDDVEGARELIRRVLSADPSRGERAEAETLLAECLLVAGERAEAVQRYLEVAERYEKHSAGENALFVAARLEGDLGRDERAAELFDLYLTRYPNGRFRADAEHRLQEAQQR